MPRVLVVDDHDDARELLALVIGSSGYEVTTAANGRAAVEETKRARPDAIIMDLFMPEMDGLEASRLIKADPALAPIPIIAYTARSNVQDIDASPFAAFCVKPCLPVDLLALLEKVLAGRSRPAGA